MSLGLAQGCLVAGAEQHAAPIRVRVAPYSNSSGFNQAGAIQHDRAEPGHLLHRRLRVVIARRENGRLLDPNQSAQDEPLDRPSNPTKVAAVDNQVGTKLGFQSKGRAAIVGVGNVQYADPIGRSEIGNFGHDRGSVVASAKLAEV